MQERLFEENRRRMKIIPYFFAKKAGMNLVYATLLATSQKCRGVRIDLLSRNRSTRLRKRSLKNPERKPGLRIPDRKNRCQSHLTGKLWLSPCLIWP